MIVSGTNCFNSMNVIAKHVLPPAYSASCRSFYNSSILYKQMVKRTEFVGRLENPKKQFQHFQKRGSFKDIPEWSYLDGKPAPPGMAKTRRRESQKQICLRIMELNNEIENIISKTTRKKRKFNQ